MPEAEPVVAELRLRFDPTAAQGVPAHVTVLGPFLDREEITERDLERIRALFAATATFAFSLPRMAFFPGVLYLAPEPAEPFARLTKAIWRRWPDHPPYGGAYAEIVPHLTVAVGGQAFAQLRRALSPRLPVAAIASEVWLIAQGEDGRWSRLERFPLGTGQ